MCLQLLLESISQNPFLFFFGKSWPYSLRNDTVTMAARPSTSKQREMKGTVYIYKGCDGKIGDIKRIKSWELLEINDFLTEHIHR